MILQDILKYQQQGTAAARPATPFTRPTNALAFYFATDTNELSIYAGGAWRTLSLTESIILAVSDETSALTVGTKIKFRMPYAFTLTDVRASLNDAQTSGSIFTVDVNENGTSVLSTKLTIDNNELTSLSGAAAKVISDTTLADDAEVTVDIDQLGTGAKGLKVTLIGFRT